MVTGQLKRVVWLSIFVFRILDEERMLVTDLPRYSEYVLRTPYRLIPGVW